MALEAILDRVARFGCELVEVTGGEPLLQAGTLPLLERLLGAGHEVLLETGGSLPIEAVPPGVRRIIDVKCPGSGESARNLWENMTHLRPGDELKFVVADRNDYDWARQQIAERGLAGRSPILFSAVCDSLDTGELARWVLEDRLDLRVQVQLHKILWPGVTRGI
jgi:7-carboxy-7-deazaguanine synthase